MTLTTPQTIERVCAAAEKGQTYDDIARNYGLDRDTVKRIIADRYGSITPMQAAKIRRMSAAGADTDTIARTLGCKKTVAERFAAQQLSQEERKYHVRQYLTVDKILRIIDMYREERPKYSYIAEKLGISDSSVSRVLRAARALALDPTAESIGDMTDYTLGMVALALKRRANEQKAGEETVTAPENPEPEGKPQPGIAITHTICAEGQFASVSGATNGKLTITVGMVQFELDAADLKAFGNELISIADAINN